MVWVLLGILVVISLLFLYKRSREKLVKPVSVRVMYSSGNGNFEATGDVEEFVIKKNDRFEFLVKDGVIVACKDRNRHSDFIFYKET
ncbi:hypothetical protein ACFSFW_15910 [Fredinandcohnia salidurans]|uniref:Uncharacterized protein n=1 Tax=Fredinandcohnia salidurans TaxID=2595041 RepID=A0ABW4MQB1_9BACI